jgi:hypothetical protein
MSKVERKSPREIHVTCDEGILHVVRVDKAGAITVEDFEIRKPKQEKPNGPPAKKPASTLKDAIFGPDDDEPADGDDAEPGE